MRHIMSLGLPVLQPLQLLPFEKHGHHPAESLQRPKCSRVGIRKDDLTASLGPRTERPTDSFRAHFSQERHLLIVLHDDQQAVPTALLQITGIGVQVLLLAASQPVCESLRQKRVVQESHRSPQGIASEKTVSTVCTRVNTYINDS